MELAVIIIVVIIGVAVFFTFKKTGNKPKGKKGVSPEPRNQGDDNKPNNKNKPG